MRWLQLASGKSRRWAALWSDVSPNGYETLMSARFPNAMSSASSFTILVLALVIGIAIGHVFRVGVIAVVTFAVVVASCLIHRDSSLGGYLARSVGLITVLQLGYLIGSFMTLSPPTKPNRKEGGFLPGYHCSMGL